jgi:hypothetical protein
LHRGDQLPPENDAKARPMEPKPPRLVAVDVDGVDGDGDVPELLDPEPE